ncbi:MAG: ComF family protein [candidate division Zixibacteria bacterium]|nr:ComF family protein [candidate division Zixibacteria bacterium]
MKSREKSLSGSKRAIQGVTEILKPLLEMVYPAICLICDSAQTKNSSPICEQCWEKLETLRLDSKIRLSDILTPESSGTNHAEATTRHDFPIYALGIYQSPLLEMIHEFKYNGFERLGIELSRELIRLKRSSLERLKADALVPVPLHSSALRRRGFNQALTVSDTISRAFEIEVCPMAVSRVKKTKDQTKLSADQRLANISGAFQLNGDFLEGKRVILVDDVITSGATISELARVALLGGASIAGAVTLAVSHRYGERTR